MHQKEHTVKTAFYHLNPQPRSQGLTSYCPTERDERDERPWERGCLIQLGVLPTCIMAYKERDATQKE